VRLEGLGKLKKSNDLIGNRTRNLPACLICLMYVCLFNATLLTRHVSNPEDWCNHLQTKIKCISLYCCVLRLVLLSGSILNFLFVLFLCCLFVFYLILVCEALGTAATPGLLCQPRVIVKMIVEKQGKPKFSERKPAPAPLLSITKSHMTRPGFERGPPRWEAGD
jgi:hypothetical protein